MKTYDIQSLHVNGGGWQPIHRNMPKKDLDRYWSDFAFSTTLRSYRCVEIDETGAKKK